MKIEVAGTRSCAAPLSKPRGSGHPSVFSLQFLTSFRVLDRVRNRFQQSLCGSKASRTYSRTRKTSKFGFVFAVPRDGTHDERQTSSSCTLKILYTVPATVHRSLVSTNSSGILHKPRTCILQLNRSAPARQSKWYGLLKNLLMRRGRAMPESDAEAGIEISILS